MRRFLGREQRCPAMAAGNCESGSDTRKVVALAGFVLTFALAPVFAQAARADTTVAFQAQFKSPSESQPRTM
jgi:hypothetical protein